MEIGSNLPRKHYRVFSRVSGTMVHGKFEGAVVNVDPTGQTFHGTFVHGKKTNDWAPGRGDPDEAKVRVAAAKPSATPAEGPTVETTAAPETASAPAAESPAAPAAESPAAPPAESPAAPPAESPPPLAQPPPQRAPAAVANTAPASSPPPPSAATAAPDNSLRSLIAPPSSLRANEQSEAKREESIPTTTAPLSAAQLSATEVVHLAETEAQLHGYDLREFRHTTPQYNPAEDIWSVSFDQRSTDATARRHFRISVEDKTQKALITGEQ